MSARCFSSSVSVTSPRLCRAKSYPADERNQWLQSGTPKGEKLNGNFPLFQVKHFSTSLHRLYGNFRRLRMMLLKINETRNHWLRAQAFSSENRNSDDSVRFPKKFVPKKRFVHGHLVRRHEKLLWCCLRDRIFQSRTGTFTGHRTMMTSKLPRARPAAKWKWKITLVGTSSRAGFRLARQPRRKLGKAKNHKINYD